MTDATPGRLMTVGAALRDALDVALALDAKVVLLGEDVADPAGGVFGVTKGLSTTHGEVRVRSTPIAEQAIIGAAVGAALNGYRPVAEIMLMDFLAMGLDQLAQHGARTRYLSGGEVGVPMTVRTAAGAGPGLGGQHASMLEAWLVHTPGLKVVAPATPADAKGLLLSAIFDDDPVVVVEPLPLYWDDACAAAVPDGDVRVPIGRAEVRRTGRDATIVTYGRPLHDCLAMANAVAAEGLDVEVVDLRTLAPWDEETVVSSVAKTRNAVVVHDAVTRGGFGAEVASRIHEELFADLEHPVLRVGAPPTPPPYAANLEAARVPGPDAIRAALDRITT
jgi:acetoin:2,6-dichlorophenolindophenol oxidoreductase subunit beta